MNLSLILSTAKQLFVEKNYFKNAFGEKNQCNGSAKLKMQFFKTNINLELLINMFLSVSKMKMKFYNHGKF